jgi:hypothetical protein
MRFSIVSAGVVSSTTGASQSSKPSLVSIFLAIQGVEILESYRPVPWACCDLRMRALMSHQPMFRHHVL